MTPIALNRYSQSADRLQIGALPEGADALVLSKAVKQKGGRAVFVARDDSRASAFKAACQFFAPDIPVLSLPAWDCLPYDRVSPSKTIGSQRAGALHTLAVTPKDLPVIVVTTIAAIQQRVPPRSVMSEAGFVAQTGAELDRKKLEAYFTSNGYARAATVMEPGDFAVRGGIIDVFTPGTKNPIRMDFFGDELESVREFDVDTQRTTKDLDRVDFAPVSEVLLSDVTKANFRRGYITAFGGGISDDPIYAAVSEGVRAQGLEHWLPLFYDTTETVFDYIGEGALTAFDGLYQEARTERWTLIEDYYQARDAHMKAQDTGSGKPQTGLFRALAPSALYIADTDWPSMLAGQLRRDHSAFELPHGDNVLNMGGRASRHFAPERQMDGVNVFDVAGQHIQTLKSDKKTVLLACWSEGSSARLGTVMTDHGLQLPEIAASRFPDLTPGTAHRAILPLEHGFEIGPYSILSEQDILGDRLVSRSRRRKAKNFIAEASALEPGDLIVHIDHGLGRYLGLKTLRVQDVPHDCLELEYGGGTRLFLPVENIELLSRYGADSDVAVLDKLGGVAWQSRKSKAKQRLKDMAEELIKIAAQRALRKAEAIDIAEGPYAEFCARFPYAETDDQLNAIEDVTSDLTSGRPMDRLICGDVGFGKTEVALRAAFLMAMSGKQVAIIAPTTVLARQHYKTFAERFKSLPVKVRQLSRLVSPKEASLTRVALTSGQVDIVIGTHALLAKTIKFRDLGLMIIDEEQRFGVKHKERLKSLRADVHVLTLTATPIPRTLQMALSGIRDLSIIATPPVDRLAIRTYVTPYDEVSLREAILRERFRGGQTYFVVPRIKDITRIEEFLRERVPEIKFVIAHGQMAGGQLEDVMTAFYEGQYDVLLSTSIIESGIDIPSANTMIVYRADRFGLAQLYQMRGRVGRSKTRAYAYMTMPDTHLVTPGALKRLKVLQSLDTLGAGFNLASHDLDMRGGGNPLGEEQSGHIKDLGTELYQHMLEEAVAELRDDLTVRDQSWSPQVNTGVAVLIPETYIQDLNLRLSTYRRMSEVEDDNESESLSAELIDRFGPLPDEVKNLLSVIKIKRLCREAHVEKVDVGPKGIVLTIRHQDVQDPQMFIRALQSQPLWKLRPDQTILIRAKLNEPGARLRGLETALKALIAEKSRVS